MSLVEPRIRYRRYQAPEQHGGTYFDPPRKQLAEVVRSNISLLRSYEFSWSGRPATQVLDEARLELVRLAREFTSRYRDVSMFPGAAAKQGPVVLSGHQPGLSHPGVWYKNFVAGNLARDVGGTAIHLITDNDVMPAPSIRVPAGSVSSPRLESVAYDTAVLGIPFEDRRLIDEATFTSFGERVEDCMRPFGLVPLVRTWWPAAVAASRNEKTIGLCLAQARHQLEGEWGNSTLEIPLSRVCETDAFRRFVAQLLSDSPRLFAVHNESLNEYRRINRIRSRTQPVSELQKRDDWWEAPFWIWSREDPRRRRLFVRRFADRVELSDFEKLRLHIATAERNRGDAAVGDVAAISARGIKVRPRALLTTMFARLMLGDVFLHGIGGGKYDQLTDAIIRRLFGVEVPQFVVTTATAHLPIDRPRADSSDLRDVDRKLRDLEFNPDRYVEVTDESSRWIAQKRNLLNAAPRPDELHSRHAGIVEANRQLGELAVPLRHQLQLERAKIELLAHHNDLLGSREFPFCLFPETTLRGLLLDKC